MYAAYYYAVLTISVTDTKDKDLSASRRRGEGSNKLVIYHVLLATPVDRGESGDGMILKRLGFVNLKIKSIGVDEVRTSWRIVSLV